ncbi:hypothetical protein K4K58_012259 [Colletotrichum sp. SAR11_239]|nr:hypothetical protein K4K58_012259 [Colletotrichum sp. SAR11_239]
MDNTPLHPAITTLAPDPSGTRHGAFLAAIPHNRSMYRTTLCLRIASLLLALVILGGVLGSMHETDDMYVSNWAMGSPTSALAMLWSGGDLVALVVRDRGVRWTKSKERPRTLIFFMFWLMVVHFALFVFACVEVDNIRRQYSDVVFVPRGELCEMVPVPPTSAWEIFVPRRMMLSYFANHYVSLREVTAWWPAATTVDQTHAREQTQEVLLCRQPTTCSRPDDSRGGQQVLYRNNGTLAEAFKFDDDDSARRKFAGRQIVKDRPHVPKRRQRIARDKANHGTR